MKRYYIFYKPTKEFAHETVIPCRECPLIYLVIPSRSWSFEEYGGDIKEYRFEFMARWGLHRISKFYSLSKADFSLVLKEGLTFQEI